MTTEQPYLGKQPNNRIAPEHSLEHVQRKISLLRSQQKLDHKRAGDIVTAISTFCGWLKLSPAGVMASEMAIDNLVHRNALGGPAVGIKDRTFTNIVGRVKTGIRTCGSRTCMPSFTRKGGYMPEWRLVSNELDRLLKEGLISSGHRRGIAHLMGYANWRGIPPVDFRSEHVVDLFDLHKENKSSGRKAADGVAAWNAIIASGLCKSFHAAPLTRPSRKRNINPSWASLNPALKVELDTYLYWMRGSELTPSDNQSGVEGEIDDEFAVHRDPSGRLPRAKAIGKAHAESIEYAVKQAAGALIRTGVDPATITDLRVIASPHGFRTTMTDFRRRRTAEGKFDSKDESGTRHLIGQILISIAEEWLGAPTVVVDEMRGLLRKIRPGHLGYMSPRRAILLRRFDDPQYRTAWYEVSERLVRKAEARRAAGDIDDVALCDMQAALAVEILQSLPVRGGNLVGIRIKGDIGRRNLILPNRSRDPVFVSWSSWEVKNDENLKAPLTARAVAILRLYLEHYWDAAVRLRGLSDSDFLFPSSDPSRPKSEPALNRIFKERMAEVGLQMTLHLARHLAAKVVLDRDPSLLEIVSRLLGHKSIETTRKFYCENRTEAASAKYQNMITEDAKEVRKQNTQAANRVRLPRKFDKRKVER